MSWTDLSACAGGDSELFFPIGSVSSVREQTRKAKAICQGCPVKSECLDWSINTNQEFGIFGGLTDDERLLLIRRASRAKRY